VNGKGDSWCCEGDIFAHFDGDGSANVHFYGERSAHGGSIKHDISSNEMVGSGDSRVEYSSRDTYFGLHSGGIDIHEICDEIFLDAYAKYVWTRLILFSKEILGFKKY
jgi:hypothetical protein